MLRVLDMKPYNGLESQQIQANQQELQQYKNTKTNRYKTTSIWIS